jgi:hypothetical protein
MKISIPGSSGPEAENAVAAGVSPDTRIKAAEYPSLLLVILKIDN